MGETGQRVGQSERGKKRWEEDTKNREIMNKND